jgi:hypothetical protein
MNAEQRQPYNTECPICMNPVTIADSTTCIILECMHAYHKSCYAQLLNNHMQQPYNPLICSICRAPVSESEKQQQIQLLRTELNELRRENIISVLSELDIALRVQQTRARKLINQQSRIAENSAYLQQSLCEQDNKGCVMSGGKKIRKTKRKGKINSTRRRKRR